MKKIERKILLNPGPATTSDEIKIAMVIPDICPREMEFCKIMDSIKQDLPAVINAGEDYTSVLFASSGTGALEAAITSGIPRYGKLLVIENGAYGTRMRNIADRFSIPAISYALPYGDYPSIARLEELLDADEQISHLCIVDHETTTGMRNPVEAVCDLAHNHGVEVIVDCMSSFAGLPINLRTWQAEYVVSSANKCLQGMPGLSFVIFRKGLLDKLKSSARSFYFDLYAQYYGFQRTGQMQYTPPVQVVYALRKALDMLWIETIEGRVSRYRKNYETLYKGMKELGFTFLLPDEYQSGILLAVKEPLNPEYSFTEMHDFLYERDFTVYPGKGAKEATFRLSILGDLYQDDIRSFLNAMREYLRYSGIHTIYYK